MAPQADYRYSDGLAQRLASCLIHLLKNPNWLTNELTVGCASYRPTDKWTEEQTFAIERNELALEQ